MKDQDDSYVSEGILKHISLAFVFALLTYVFFYNCDRHMRLHKGPWQLTFEARSDGTPMLVIDQPALGIEGVVLRFEGEFAQAMNHTIAFVGPGISVPFGKLIFFDTTYLPGTLTLELFGHQIEMMQRTLILNFQEHPWRSKEEITLLPNEKWQFPKHNN